MSRETIQPQWTVIEGDCLKVLPTLTGIAAIVTDPPYGMKYRSSMGGRFGDCQITGDGDTSARDAVIAWAATQSVPVIAFGNWRVQRPASTAALLVWDKGDHVGMGDLSLPWKPNTEEVYVIGSGFVGHRGSSVLRFNAVSPNFRHTSEPHEHPTQKPVALMRSLIDKCPAGTILDPFMGSGSTGVACMQTGRRFIGIEIDPKHCQIARRRISEAANHLFAGGAA